MSFVRSIAVKRSDQQGEKPKKARTIVMEEFFNEVDMGQHHASAAVSFELKLVEGISTML